MRDLRALALPVARWHFREVYVDRGPQDPLYLVDFKPIGDDAGDFVGDQPLFASRYPFLSGISLTHDRKGPNRPAWEALSGLEVSARLERFIGLYRDDALQPPGRKQGWFTPGVPHDRIAGRRFLFQLRGPALAVAGVGPARFALGDEASLCGQVLGAARQPIGGAIVELVASGRVLRRTTLADGHFWFSRLPPGVHTLRLPDRSLRARILDALPHGVARGAVRTTGGAIVTGQRIELEAPDGELFTATTGADGTFATGPLPPFSYRLRVPPFLFTAQVSHVADGQITGTLVDEDGHPRRGLAVVLLQAGTKLARVATDADGRFSFPGLPGGRFDLRVPGCTLYLRATAGALELIARGAVA